MAKSTIESIEKVIKKFLTPIESKIDQILIELKKMDEKILSLEKNTSLCAVCSKVKCQDLPKKSEPNQQKQKVQTQAAQPTRGPCASKPVVTVAVSNRRTSLPQTSERPAATVTSQSQQRNCTKSTAPTYAQALTPPPRLSTLQPKHLQNNNPPDTNVIAADKTPPTLAEVGDRASVTKPINNDTINNDEPEHSSWQKVNNTKRRRSKLPKRRHQQRVVVKGSGELDEDLKTIVKTRKLHACFFKADTTPETIKCYMERKNPDANYTVNKIALKHSHYASFALNIPANKFEFFTAPENWPSGTEVSEWFRASGGRPRRRRPEDTIPSTQPAPSSSPRRDNNSGEPTLQ